MIKAPVFTIKGTKTGEAALPKEFDQKVNLHLLAQAVYVYEERSHVGLRKTKTRSEVNRTSKKLYKQKGTGGARHGSRRANLFVGGGVALGPRPVRRILNLSDKLKSRAKLFAYSLKAGEGQIVMVSGLSKIEKTKEVGDLIKALRKATGAKRFTFALSESAGETFKFMRNLTQVKAIFFKDANAFDIYRGGLIVLDKDILSPVKKQTKKITK
jgi:large subunit ribosomal protein L4